MAVCARLPVQSTAYIAAPYSIYTCMIYAPTYILTGSFRETIIAIYNIIMYRSSLLDIIL